MSSTIFVIAWTLAVQGPAPCSALPDQRPPLSDPRVGEEEARLALVRHLLGQWGEDARPGKRVVWLQFDRLTPSKRVATTLSTAHHRVKLLEGCPPEAHPRCHLPDGNILFVRDARWCSDTELLLDAGNYTNSIITDEMGCSYRLSNLGGTWRAEVTEWCWAE